MSTPASPPPKRESALPRLGVHDELDIEISTTYQTETNQVAPTSVRRALRDVLTVLVGFDAGRVLALTEGETWIGRDAECHLILPDPDVSRRHASLIKRGTRTLLRDHASKNGTFVGGERVTER